MRTAKNGFDDFEHERMFPMARENREDRRKIMSHFHHFHGQPKLNFYQIIIPLDWLKDMHREMHSDGYFCPPHYHNSDGEIELLLGEDYLRALYSQTERRFLETEEQGEEVSEEESKKKKKKKKSKV